MKSITIELSDEEHAFLRRMVESGECATPEEAVQSVVKQRKLEASRERLKELVREGMEGPAVEMDEAEMDRIWTEARRQLGERLAETQKESA